MKKIVILVLLISLIGVSYELFSMRDTREIYSYDNKCNAFITRNKDIQSIHIIKDDVSFTANRFFSMTSHIDIYFSTCSYDFYIYSTDVGTIAYVYDEDEQTWNGDYAFCWEDDIFLWDYRKQIKMQYDDFKIPDTLKSAIMLRLT